MAIISQALKLALWLLAQAQFEREARSLTALLFEASGRTRVWQRGMISLVKRHNLTQALLGAGRMLTAAELAEINERTVEQLAFLSRFADQIALARMRHAPMSIEQVAARAIRYSGIGFGLGYEFYELTLPPGWVIDYIAKDINGACAECLEAVGTYLPGEGDFPGDVCLGGGYCRCERRPRYAPLEYAALVKKREKEAA